MITTKELKKRGGLVIPKSVLQQILLNSAFEGMLLKIENCSNYISVDVDIYGATVGPDGISHNTSIISCGKESCSLDGNEDNIKTELSEYQYEHMGEFRKFEPEKAFAAYASKEQIQMILDLETIGEFEKVFITSYIPNFSKLDRFNDIVSNFSLKMEPFNMVKQARHQHTDQDQKSTSLNRIGSAPFVLLAGCNQVWYF